MEQKKPLIHRLRNKYRLVVMNDATFEEKASLRLSKLNVFIVLSSLLVFFTALVYSLIAFTELKAYIPGYMNRDQTQLLLELSYRIDSLEQVIDANERMLNNEMNILRDTPDTTREQEGGDTIPGDVDLQPSNRELQMRENMKPGNDYTIDRRQSSGNIVYAPFFTPLNGLVSARFDPRIDHLATDIVSSDDQTVKSVLEGTVVLASWTPETGNVIAVQHGDNLLSIYKHNSVLLKKVGNFVDAGEAIAIVGNSGELSSGPHLHFELWHEGIALNAEDYLVFK